MTQYPATRTPAAPASQGIDLKTLLITAVSSAAAAYACSQIWAPGTLAAAAFTPVLVAIIREGLAKSTAVVVSAVPVRGIVRSARPEDAPAAGATRAWSAEDLAAEQPSAGEPLLSNDPADRVAQPGEVTYHGSGTRRRNWRVAIVTGLLGFLVAAVVFTVPELVAGESASGGGRGTTLFGGKQRDRATPATTTTTTTTAPEEEAITTPQEEVVTVPPQTVTTPPPAVTTPEDPEATPPPDPATTQPPPPVAEPPPPVEIP